jgi:hypothetical protein
VFLFAAQLVGLVVYSVHIWRRFDLTSDFAAFHQAWQQIATGNLDPRLTTFAYQYPNYGYPFWQSHFELAMWPLALLWYGSHSSLVLLIVQDVALAGAGLVALRWGLELLETHWPPRTRGQTAVGIGLLVVLLVNPWTYWTASFDFHFQPIACLAVLAAGRDLWAGRRRGWCWVAVALLCGDVAATYVLALGIAAVLAGRRTWRSGAGLIGASLIWLAIVSALGAGKGSTLEASYGYLAGGTAVGSGLSGITAIARGVILHPRLPFHVLRVRDGAIYKYVASAGTIGLFSTIGAPMAVVVLAANGLNASPNFSAAPAAFQSLAVSLFAALGAVAVVTWLARRGGVATWLAAVVALAALAQSVVVTIDWTPKASRAFLKVPAPVASTLGFVEHRIPPAAEVVVSQGVVGRFGGHRWVYPFIDSFVDGQTVPVNAPTVAFVFTDTGLEAASAAQTAAAVGMVRARLHARTLVQANGVDAFVWNPPAGVASVSFPK